MSGIFALLESLRRDEFARRHTVHWEHLPARTGRWTDLPDQLHPALRGILLRQGKTRLYGHQGEAYELAQRGRDVLVTTPTASGKSLCLHLPILDRLLKDSEACALYLAPTKALAQDQYQELRRMAEALPSGAALTADAIAVYDGDTPTAARRALRSRARLLISNPDMLHFAILPHHAAGWHSFLAHLDFVAVDEIHVYRGVFGSHVANVFRRLARLCHHHNPDRPIRFLCASATVANAEEQARWLLGREVHRITRNGAPAGERHVLLFNPPVIPDTPGLRDAPGAVCHFARRTQEAAVQSLVFGRTRMEVERLLLDLRAQSVRQGMSPAEAERRICGYRGGYLPAERRRIERGLRDGSVRTVTTTNALELGIDIGQLQCVLMLRYAGTIAGTWQQMGRAGRRDEPSLAVLVASHNPLDQYLMAHPEFLFARTPEHALLDPDHPTLLLQHLACALAERPVPSQDVTADPYGQGRLMQGALAYMAQRRRAYHRGTYWFHQGEPYVADRVSLRNMGRLFTITEGMAADGPLLGTLEEEAAPGMVHEGAIYMHQGLKYQVAAVDFEARSARVEAVPQATWRTQPISQVDIQVSQVHEQTTRAGALIGHGVVKVKSQVVGFRRLHSRYGGRHSPSFDAMEVEEVECPARTVTTQAYWLQVPPQTQRRLEARNAWRDSRNDYGPDWDAQRKQARALYGTKCARCGRRETPARTHHVHHIRPFRTFGYVPGHNRHHLTANALENLRVLCPSCHRLSEPPQWQGLRGLAGLGQALANLAPLHLMCDPSDLSMVETLAEGSAGQRRMVERKEGFDPALATIFLHERFEGGLGFGQMLFGLHGQLMEHVDELIRNCACTAGCPACVGPAEEAPDRITRKGLAASLVSALRQG